MKYIVVNEDQFFMGHYLVSDDDAARLLELRPSDSEFQVTCWSFDVYGFKSWTSNVAPCDIVSVEIKPFPS